jgi:hypothetical protein
LIGIAAGIEPILRPAVDRMRNEAAAMIEINRRKGIILVKTYVMPSACPACTVVNAVV